MPNKIGPIGWNGLISELGTFSNFNFFNNKNDFLHFLLS